MNIKKNVQSIKNPNNKKAMSESIKPVVGDAGSNKNPKITPHNKKIGKKEAKNGSASKLNVANKNIHLIKQNCKVDPSKLKKYTERSSLPSSTALAPQLLASFGQPRAVDALETAFDIQATGYHVFAVGENGLGKRTFISQYLKHQGHAQGALFDWIYVHNFKQPRKPIAIAVEPGTSSILVSKTTEIWNQLSLTLNDELLSEIRTNSCSLNPLDYSDNSTTPVINKPTINATGRHSVELLHQQHAEQVLTPFFDDLMSTFANNDKLITHLEQLKEDMISNAYTIALGEDSRFLVGSMRVIPDRYSITVMFESIKQEKPDLTQALEPSNGKQLTINGIQSATNETLNQKAIEFEVPIVFEAYPKLANLLGFIEQTTEAGSLITNHSMIMPGALHRANGGYLLIEAIHLIEHPTSWQALKLALQSGIIDLSNYQQNKQHAGLSLLPEPIPLKVKVILLGDPELYDQFAELDPEFNATFKIRADFHDEVIRNPENERSMTAKMADIIAKYQMRHFDNTAQAVILEQLSLQCEDQNKLSLHTDRLIQIMLEANRHSLLKDAVNSETLESSPLVNAVDVKQALENIHYRSGYLKELYLQEITNGQQLINTKGSAIGQINALTIVDYADSEFGMPALLTAVVQHSVGSGDILDIERDVELGGSLHAKGMLIMNSYLRALFSPYHPLNFTASLAFEQSYAHIDGDSATLAEACALLSALAEVPIAQSLAITGSMNQLGRVQAVGGINAKVAGFFDACAHQGLSGKQGVILPFANINQLMLRDDIVSAVEQGQFHIYGVNTLSEALTILSNKPVDTMTKKGKYHKSSLFGKIIKNLKKWEEQLNPPEEISDSVNDEMTTKSKPS